FARKFRTGGSVLPAHSHRLGYVPELIIYQDEADLKLKLDRLAEHLLVAENLRPDEITILSARKPAAPESAIRQIKSFGKAPLFFSTPGKANDAEAAAVKVSTVSAFKGLEPSVGIIVNLS